MDLELISQIQMSSNDKTLAEIIIEILERNCYSSFKMLAAFVNFGGISGLSDVINKSSIYEKKAIVGIDNKITSVEALDEMLRIGFTCKVAHNSSSFIYHPKLYLFENVQSYSVIIGSGNLTTGGLVYNDECFVRITGDKLDSFYLQVNSLFNQLWYSDNENIKQVDDLLINELYSIGLIASETEKQSTPNSIIDGLFGKVKSRQFPQGFSPKKVEKINVGKLIRLLPHNQEIYNEITNEMQHNLKGYVVQPTGTGKSYLIGKYIQDHIDEKMILVAPNKIIIDSVKSITGKLPANVIFQTYQYLSRNIDRTKIIANGIKHILIDEFHHAGAFTWSKAIHELMLNADNPHVLGFSATPERDNDDIDVASMFFGNNCIHSLSLFECWDKSILPMPKLVQSFVEVDYMLSKIEDELSAKYSKQHNTLKKIHKQVQDIKSKYISIASLETVIKDFIPQDTKRVIVFVPNIDSINSQMETLSVCLKNAGFFPTCFQVHSKQSEKENRKQLAEFKESHDGVNLMFSVDKLIEGIHMEDVDALILLRSTESVRIALQQLGRCLSSGKRRTPVVLDLVNNYKAGNIFGMSIHNGVCSDVEAEVMAKQLNILGNYAEIKQAIADLYSKFNTWDDNFSALLEKKRALGRIPKFSDSIGNLYQWWISQKKEYRDGKMPQEHIEKFQNNGFILDRWDYMFERLKSFMEVNKRIPNRKDGELGIWRNKQCQNYRDGILTPTHASKLQSIGIKLKIKKEWGEWYETLKKFIKDKKREPRSKNKEESAVYSWLHRQRQEYKEGKLEEYQIIALKDLKISLEYSSYEIAEEDRFYSKLEKVKQYVKKHKKLPKIKENQVLYNWINGEKQKIREGTIKPERIKQLAELGIYVDSFEEWKIKYDGLKSFVDKYGRVPTNDENMELFEWWQRQIWAMRKIKNDRSGLNDTQISLIKELTKVIPTNVLLQWN